MVALTQPFDANTVDPSQQLPQLPIGRHPVVIIESGGKTTKSGDGGFLEFLLQIIDGPAKGVKGTYRLNIYNQNADTVRIAYQQFSALCHVCGIYVVQNTEQLHNLPFIIDVDFQKGEEARQKGYTQVTRVYDRNMQEPGKQGQAPAAAQPVPVANAPAAAWPAQPQAAAPAQAAPAPATASQPSWAGGNGGGAPPAQQQAPAWGAPTQQAPPPAAAAPPAGAMPWTPR